ncbi:SDR family oxidoreductase [Actinoallomurus sp. NPDC052308]|uniref:SDR family NAD(P)-dependent oxidoreductase n=1 Tax=Actinoallomurus sp. NPDC052308 TaxID=3155530 RepID=UPI00343F7E24
MSQRFAAKVALITGAASGIGRATTLRLVGEGATVFAVDLDAERLKETASLADGTVTTRTADVSDPATCAAVVQECVDAYSRIDVLGNIAGVARSDHFTELTVEQYRRLMGVNVDACFFLSQAAVPYLLETGGNIINIASSAGLVGQAYTVAYCASKGAVIQMTKALAMEYVKRGIRVNAIAPGVIDTPLIQNWEFPTDVEVDLLMRYAPLRNAGEAEDVASLFAYVASDEGRSIHGAVLSVDNGMAAG